MWARFTVLRDTPIDSAIAGCVIPFRSNTIWMRWRCWGCPFQRSAVFKRRISFLVHLTTCSSESNQIRWSVRIILRLTNAIHIRIRCFATINIRFNQLWKRYKTVMIYSIATPGGRDHSADWSGAIKRANDADAAMSLVEMGFPGNAQSEPEGAVGTNAPTVTITSDEANLIRDQLDQGHEVLFHLKLDTE